MTINRRTALGMIGAAAAFPSAASAQGLFINPFEERILGVKGHPQAIEQYGGFYANPALSAYVNALGSKLARALAKYPDQFVFTVINNPEVNACARMGGFIYINTGLLPWCNDEAQFAGIFGHEVGHSIKRHTAHAINRDNAGSLITRLRALRHPEEYEATKIKASLAIMSYGRDNEDESDAIAVPALNALGYDPFAMSEALYNVLMFSRIYESINGASTRPIELRSHPFTVDRIRSTAAAARQFQPTAGTGKRNRDAYLDAIDGLRLAGSAAFVKRPVTLRVVPVRPSDTVAGFVARMAPSTVKRDLFMGINGLDDEAGLRTLTRVKLLV